MNNENLISWEFPEYEKHDRKKSWYFWAIFVFLFFLVYSVLTANFLFGLIVIMATIIFFVKNNEEPRDINFEITPDGVQIGNHPFKFKEIKKFWLVYEPPTVKNLYLDLKSSIRPTLIIPLTDINPIKVRKILKEYVEEDLDKESESTTEALMRRLKI